MPLVLHLLISLPFLSDMLTSIIIKPSKGKKKAKAFFFFFL